MLFRNALLLACLVVSCGLKPKAKNRDAEHPAPRSEDPTNPISTETETETPVGSNNSPTSTDSNSSGSSSATSPENEGRSSDSTTPAESVALKDFDGIWVLDSNKAMGLDKNCRSYLLVNSTDEMLERATVCRDDIWEIETLKISEFKNTPAFSNRSGGFIGKPSESLSTCASNSELSKIESVFFDTDTQAGAEAASYLWVENNNKHVAFKNGSSVATLGRNNSCSSIESLASRESRSSALFKDALALCKKTITKLGCVKK